MRQASDGFDQQCVVDLPDEHSKLVIRGLEIGEKQLDIIRDVLAQHHAEGRTRASIELCACLDFHQPNGWPKERAMRDILRRLAEMGLVRLPELKIPLRAYTGQPKAGKKVELDQTPITEAFDAALSVRRAHTPRDIGLWDHCIHEHHYLGRRSIVGRNLKQLIFLGERPIACLAWADPCLRLAPRDEFLRMNGVAETDLARGVNNVRFLLLPWVKVPNLASRVLSLAMKHMRDHWAWYYHSDLLWAETFVDPSRYRGTCYLAANWSAIGETRGTARIGMRARRIKHGQQKQILIYRFGPRRKRVG